MAVHNNNSFLQKICIIKMDWPVKNRMVLKKLGRALPPLSKPPKKQDSWLSSRALSGAPRVGPRERPRQCRGLEKAVGSHELGTTGPSVPWCRTVPVVARGSNPPPTQEAEKERGGVWSTSNTHCSWITSQISSLMSFVLWWLHTCFHTTNQSRFQSVSNPSDGDQVKQ